MYQGRFSVGLVGCGRISKNHFEAISRVPELDLVAVCDVDRSRAETAGAERGVPCFFSLSDMLSQGPPSDLIAVCTPSGLHPAHGAEAARAGRHVLVEKPMAVSLEAADMLVRECDSAGVQLFVVKQNRLNPAV